jgi:prepilin-type N-terminal cleavage/methylation domain-containing protein
MSRFTQYAARSTRRAGFTLIEVMLGAAVLAIAIVALLGAFLGESFLVAHAQALQGSMADATRIMEQLRQQNIGCAAPSARPPAPHESWDIWLEAQQPAKVLGTHAEAVAVTCQDADGGALPGDYCGANQAGTKEWKVNAAQTAFDPIQATVAVGYQVRGRVVGASGGRPEFRYLSATPLGAGEQGEWRELERIRCVGVDGSEMSEEACRDQASDVACTCAKETSYVLIQLDGRSSAGGGQTTAAGRLVAGADEDRDGLIESQAMLTTLVTCR